MKLIHTPSKSSLFRRLVTFLLTMALFISLLPPYVRAADESTYGIPGDDKVFALEAESTNGHNEAKFLFLDHHQEEARVYIVFEVNEGKPIISATVEVGGEPITDLTLLGTYDSLTVEDTGVVKYPTDSKNVWQVTYFEHDDLQDGSHICISAKTKAGGFNLTHVDHSLHVSYGMTVTKELATVNGAPAQVGQNVAVGDTLTWVIHVENHGEVEIDGITVEEQLPGAVMDVTGSFDLLPGEIKQIIATYVVQPADAGKEIVNVVVATSDHGLAEGGSSSASQINYAVVYDANGGTDAPELQTKYADIAVSITDGIPKRDGYQFTGWNTAADGSGTDYSAGTPYTENANLTLYAQWKKLFSVRFHANLPGVDESIFRTYYPADIALPEGTYALETDHTVKSFYDIPQFDYETHNAYIFKGWYLADGTPINWNTVYTKDTDIYAHWIETGTVAQSADDGKQLPAELGGAYPGYELVGIQVRGEGSDDIEHYGEVGSGLRYISVLSQAVYSQINALPGNEAGAEYGFVLAKATTIPADAELLYKGSNVNGQNTSTSHAYAMNLKCSGVPDHYSNVDENDRGYRLYTGVVTYKSAALQGDAVLQQAYSQHMVARAYIRYYDANGLLRTYHSNYTGNSRAGNGCSASYNMAMEMLQQ